MLGKNWTTFCVLIVLSMFMAEIASQKAAAAVSFRCFLVWFWWSSKHFKMWKTLKLKNQHFLNQRKYNLWMAFSILSICNLLVIQHLSTKAATTVFFWYLSTLFCSSSKHLKLYKNLKIHNLLFLSILERSLWICILIIFQ